MRPRCKKQPDHSGECREKCCRKQFDWADTIRDVRLRNLSNIGALTPQANRMCAES
jgi:hypothetical protein